MPESTLTAYATSLLGDEDATLKTMREEAEAAGLPTIQVPLELGRLLAALAARSEHVLEIGTLFGYSSVLMARALPAGGRITSLEVEPKHAAIARTNLARAGVADKVTVLEGNALETLKSLAGQSFDLVFIDADKASYAAYLEAALNLTRPGSIIVADNLWRNGAVLDPQDPNAAGIVTFNQALAANPNLVTTLIPTREGGDAASLSVVRRNS